MLKLNEFVTEDILEIASTLQLFTNCTNYKLFRLTGGQKGREAERQTYRHADMLTCWQVGRLTGT
jgi:hypothetical protein